MKKFNQYIIENENEKNFELIKKDCQPFLKEIGNDVEEYILYRGMGSVSKNFLKKTVRKDRTPKDINKQIHKIFDKLFHKKFKIYGRSQCMFISGNETTASKYGTVYSVFPIGKIKFIWSPKVWDLFDQIRDKIDRARNITKYCQSVVDKYRKTNLKKAIESENEVMIDCNSYYAILYDEKTLASLAEYLK